MVARIRQPQAPQPLRDPTVVVVLTHDAHEIGRRAAMPGDAAAKAAIMLICAKEDGLVVGDRLRVVRADVDGEPLPPPRIKHG